MEAPARVTLQWLVEAHSSGRPLVMLFDLDGTLVPLADHPRQSRMPAAAREALAQLSQTPDVFAGVISGRPVDDVKELVALPHLYYAGSGGLELDLLGLRVTPPNFEAGQGLLAEALRALAPVAECHPGAWVETKPLGMTVHYRALAPEQAGRLLEALDRELERLSGGLQVYRVNKAVEVVPAFGWSKATALEKVVEDAARDALPFYAGDEANDAEALQMARELGGLAVGVGEFAPASAQLAVESPRALLQVLQKFLSQIDGGRARRTAVNADKAV